VIAEVKVQPPSGYNTDRITAMPKRKPSAKKPAESMTPLRKAMSGCSKAELLDILLELAEADRGIHRQLTGRFNVPAAPAELIASTRRAIIDATDFDERDRNRNFDYDFTAYDELKGNLKRLIGVGQLETAMELSLELIKRGSYQVEMSDEGLMTQDIEDCLSVVLKSLRTCDLPVQKLITWCSAMLKNDRVQFIATEELQSLRSHFQATAEKA
jgi:hypothetical protein